MYLDSLKVPSCTLNFHTCVCICSFGVIRKMNILLYTNPCLKFVFPTTSSILESTHQHTCSHVDSEFFNSFFWYIIFSYIIGTRRYYSGPRQPVLQNSFVFYATCKVNYRSKLLWFHIKRPKSSSSCKISSCSVIWGFYNLSNISTDVYTCFRCFICIQNPSRSCEFVFLSVERHARTLLSRN